MGIPAILQPLVLQAVLVSELRKCSPCASYNIIMNWFLPGNQKFAFLSEIHHSGAL